MKSERISPFWVNGYQPFSAPLKQYIQEHNGKIPSADDPSPKVRELAAALQMMKNLKERKMRGLDFNPDEFKK